MCVLVMAAQLHYVPQGVLHRSAPQECSTGVLMQMHDFMKDGTLKKNWCVFTVCVCVAQVHVHMSACLCVCL